MSRASAGVKLIGGIAALTASAVIPEQRIQVVNLYPHLDRATPEVRDCVDRFYRNYSSAVPEDWIVLRRAQEDCRIVKQIIPSYLNTWVGLADYLNAREGVDLVRGDRPKYYASSLVLYYILNEWMPNHGFDRSDCYQKYAAGVADYIEFSCHRMPPYPAMVSRGQITQYFRGDISRLNVPEDGKPAPADYLTPGQVVWTAEQRRADEKRREEVTKILVEGYGRIQKEIQQDTIRKETFKAYMLAVGLPILVGIFNALIS